MKSSPAKSTRLLQLYSRLAQGEVLSKQELAQRFCVTQRSIQRDMESLRCFFAEEGLPQEVVYDRHRKGYVLEDHASSRLTDPELLALCKILLESRSLVREEMTSILHKLAAASTGDADLNQLVSNELFHYVPPHHGQPLLESVWAISQAVEHQQLLEIEYQRMKEPHLVRRVVAPVGVMFSEYYFYLTALLPAEKRAEFGQEDGVWPTIYRIDRIRSFKVLEEHFHVPYRDRFQEGEFRKRVQFMYGGKLQRVKFRYHGPSVEAVLDRLPTAEILEQDAGGTLIEAEVYGLGIELGLRSQGSMVDVLEPAELAERMKQ